MLKSALAAALILIAGTVGANAACAQKDLKGIWLFTARGQICEVKIAGNGTFSEGMCREIRGSRIDGARRTIDGRLSVTSACAVSGKLIGVSEETLSLEDGTVRTRDAETFVPITAVSRSGRDSVSFVKQF